MSPSCFPQRSDKLTPRSPPPVQGGAGSPASTVLSGRYDFLPSVPPRFVSFARTIPLAARVSLARGRRCRGRVCLELVTRYLRPGIGQWRRQDLLRSWGTPIVLLPCSPTPVGPTHQALAMRLRGPRYVHDEGSRIRTFELSITRLSALAAYASQAGPIATQDSRFRLLADLFGPVLTTRRVP